MITVEIDPHHQAQARKNLRKAGLSHSVTFVSGDILDRRIPAELPPFDAAPDWAVTAPGRIYRFLHSNTRPPADLLLETILERTEHVALVLPPLADTRELAGLPPNERETVSLGETMDCPVFISETWPPAPKTPLFAWQSDFSGNAACRSKTQARNSARRCT